MTRAATGSAGAQPRFEALVGRLDYPMLVVTAAAGERRAGCLVGFATQASIAPPRFVVCISRRNHTFAVIESGAQALAVHFLGKKDMALAQLFGAQTGDEIEKFGRARWRATRSGTPVLCDCPNWFVGAIRDRLELGDHVGYLLEPEDAHEGEPLPDLSFADVGHLHPGHEA